MDRAGSDYCFYHYYYFKFRNDFFPLLANTANVSLSRCNYFTTSYSYWMATIDEDQQFKRPVPQTLKAGDLRSRLADVPDCVTGEAISHKLYIFPPSLSGSVVAPSA